MRTKITKKLAVALCATMLCGAFASVTSAGRVRIQPHRVLVLREIRIRITHMMKMSGQTKNK